MKEVYILYRKNAGALVVAGKEIGVEVNGERTKYMVKSIDQNAERSQNVNDNSSFERVVEIKYLEKTFINQITIKSKLKAESACYHSVQNRLSSSMISKI